MSIIFSDEEIIKIIKNGSDQRVYHQLYRVVFPKIKKMIMYKGGTPEDARDVFQDAVLVFYKNVKKDSYELRTEIDAFIYSVSRNLWYNIVRKEKRKSYFEDGEENKIADVKYDKLIDEERQKAIVSLFSRIGERCKELLIYKFYDGLNMTEIKEKMNFSNENSAKTQHYKCKQKLIELIGKNEVSMKELLRID